MALRVRKDFPHFYNVKFFAKLANICGWVVLQPLCRASACAFVSFVLIYCVITNTFQVTPEVLPSCFDNEIDAIKTSKKKFVIRSNITKLQDIDRWIREFSFNTRTKWNVRSSLPKGEKVVCSKKIVCHHSSFMKVRREDNRKGISKNSNCPANILVQIKLNTSNTRASDNFVRKGLCGIISIENLHSHTIDTAESLRFLPAAKDVKNKFFEYFDDGMGIAESRKHHERHLELIDYSNAVEYNLASGRVNPTDRTVRYWHDEWRQLHLGPRSGSGVIEKLKEKQSLYSAENVTLIYEENPFAILILTPLMKRAHELDTAKEIVFMDSTSSCDPENHSVTFLLTPCAVGAVPLAIILTKGQTHEAYSTSLGLIKKALPNSFCGQGYPKIFVTDHSAAEINAINHVFPHSKTYLCIFHVMQAVWRWLWDSKHQIEKDDRPVLMSHFKKILYSTSIIEAEQAYASAIENCNHLEKWKKYLNDYWSIKEHWSLAWRDISCRGHFTNNFSEVCVRLFKDNVLSRVKAYNVISLVDFVCTVLEAYYRHRLREFSNCRTSSTRLFLHKLMKKSEYVKKDDIVQIDCNIFQVPSSTEEKTYLVDIEIGCCSCNEGQNGKFCKHQCVVYKYFDVKSQNFPAVSPTDRHSIARLVLGEQTPPITFYQSFLLEQRGEEQAPASTSIDLNNIDLNKFQTSEDPQGNMESTKAEEENLGVEPIINLIAKCGKTFGSSFTGVRKLTERLSKIRTKGQWETFLHTAGNSAALRCRSGSAIRVQPTSLSRRRAGITRGSKRLPGGRPPKGETVVKKRPRNLTTNIKLNRQNAKSHGKFH